MSFFCKECHASGDRARDVDHDDKCIVAVVGRAKTLDGVDKAMTRHFVVDREDVEAEPDGPVTTAMVRHRGSAEMTIGEIDVHALVDRLKFAVGPKMTVEQANNARMTALQRLSPEEQQAVRDHYDGPVDDWVKHWVLGHGGV